MNTSYIISILIYLLYWIFILTKFKVSDRISGDLSRIKLPIGIYLLIVIVGFIPIFNFIIIVILIPRIKGDKSLVYKKGAIERFLSKEI